MNKQYIFELKMSVRDYECDLQGIVNNANYLHYMEHTRHQFLLSEGVSFIQLHEEGTDCVVARMNIAYKTPLRSDDEFVSCINLCKEGVRYVFYQDIYKLPEYRLVIKAQVDVVCLQNGRLSECELLNERFGKYWEAEK